MATRNRASSRRGPSIEPEQQSAISANVASKLSEIPASPTNRLPEAAKFPLLVTLSMGLSSTLYAFSSSFTSGDLSTVSAHRDQWWEVAGLLAWRVTELGTSWYGGFDTTDQAALTFLSHLPYLFFLTSFYKIRPTTATVCIFIDLVATATPFYLLRKTLASHSFRTPKNAVANRSVINDWSVHIFTSLFATCVYAVVVSGSFGTWLPKYLVTHFEGIKDISSLYNSTFIWLVAAFLPIGVAVKTFLFTPSIAAKPDFNAKEIASFNAETATLRQTIAYNLWGKSERVKVLVQRTGTLAATVGLNTWLHTYMAVDGSEGAGAAGWSAVWAIAATITGILFKWVGDVEGIAN